MPYFVIGYDLKSGQDYSELVDEIKSFRPWWHHLDSTWIIKSSKSAEAIRNQLKVKLPSETDKLLVMRYVTSKEKAAGSAAWAGFNTSGKAWLKKNL